MTSRSDARGPAARSDARAEEVRRLADPPVLAWLTAIGLVIELVVGRLALTDLRLRPEETATYFAIANAMRPVRALVVITATIGTAQALFRFFRMPGFGWLPYRLLVAGVAGVALPAGTIALVTPAARLGPALVALGLVSTLVLAVLLGLPSWRYRSRPASWVGLAVSAMSLAALVALAGAAVRGLVLALGVASLTAWSKPIGEVLFCSVPLLAAVSVLEGSRKAHGVRTAVFAATTVIATVAIGAYLRTASPHAGRLLYAGFRLSALEERQSVLYAIPLAATVGVVAQGLVMGRPRFQLALGTLLFVAAGYAPRNLTGVSALLLALLLFARSAQVSHPEGQRRARFDWSPDTRRMVGTGSTREGSAPGHIE